MKQLILACFLILLCTFQAVAGTEDQEVIVSLQAVFGSVTIPFITPPTAGCTMTVAGVFVGAGEDMTFEATPVIDSDGNTFDTTLSSLAGRQIALVAVADNISVTPPYEVTIQVPILEGHYDLVVAKSFCGLANPAKDQVATAVDAGPQESDATVTTSSTAQANETVIAALSLCQYDGGDDDLNIATPSGYASIVKQQNCLAYEAGEIVWKNVTVQGAQSATWSHDDVTGSSAYDGWVTAIMTLKDAIPGGVVVRRRNPVLVQ